MGVVGVQLGRKTRVIVPPTTEINLSRSLCLSCLGDKPPRLWCISFRLPAYLPLTSELPQIGRGIATSCKARRDLLPSTSVRLPESERASPVRPSVRMMVIV